MSRLDTLTQEVRRNATTVLGTDARFENGDARPLGTRGRRTRATILKSASQVFIETGWNGASIAAISDQAGVAVGTVYQYFRSKEEIISAIVAEWALKALADVRTWDPADGLEGLAGLIGRYVDMYARTAKFQRLWEEVSVVEPALAELRAELTELFVHMFADAFVTASKLGLIDAGPDPVETSRAINAMIDRYCLQVFVRRSSPAVRAQAAELLTGLALRALTAD